MIIRRLPDIASLSALVHASPAYHALYAAHRERILTRFTVVELSNRSINVTQRASFLEVNVKGDGLPSPHIKTGILALHKALREQMMAQLSVEQCLALLTLRQVVTWSVTPAHHSDKYRGHYVAHTARARRGAIVHFVSLSPLEHSSSIHEIERYFHGHRRCTSKWQKEADSFFFIDLESKTFPRMTPLSPRLWGKVRILLERGEHREEGTTAWH